MSTLATPNTPPPRSQSVVPAAEGLWSRKVGESYPRRLIVAWRIPASGDATPVYAKLPNGFVFDID